jgi:hypothetical protein
LRPEYQYRTYAHLPASQRQCDEAEEQGKPPPKSYRTKNFYQVVPIHDILYRVPMVPTDLEDIEDPAHLFLALDLWGI